MPRVKTGFFIDIAYNIEEEQKEIAYATLWETLKDIRSVLLKALEIEREKGLIKHSLEAQVKAFIDLHQPKFAGLADFFNQMKEQELSPEAFFKEFLIVSNFMLVGTREGLYPSTDEGIAVLVSHAEGNKCPR